MPVFRTPLERLKANIFRRDGRAAPLNASYPTDPHFTLVVGAADFFAAGKY